MTADCTANHPVGMAYKLGKWLTIAGRPESPGNWMTADLYQACLIFHHQLVDRRGCQSCSGHGPLDEQGGS